MSAILFEYDKITSGSGNDTTKMCNVISSYGYLTVTCQNCLPIPGFSQGYFCEILRSKFRGFVVFFFAYFDFFSAKGFNI